MYEQYDLKTWSPKIQDYCVEKEIPMPRWPDVQDILADHYEAKFSTGAISVLPQRAHEEELDAFLARLLRGMREKGFLVDEKHRQGVGWEIAKRIIRLGVLDPFLDEEGVEEIIVRNGFVRTERWGEIHDEGRLQSDDYFLRLARKIADMQGKGLGRADPQIKIGLPDGSRFTATIPPLSREGTAINIRRFAKKNTMTFDDLLEAGSIDEETVYFLTQVARSMNVNVVFSGKPGAGKTTWLNAFSQHLPRDAQVSCVETFEELDLHVEHPQRLIVEENPEEMSRAINTVILRMRPDALMIGEIVSREAMQYIRALNLGIVTYTTTHASSARLALTRLETLSSEADTLEQRRNIMGEARLLIVHLAKERDEKTKKHHRLMSELLAITGVTDAGDYQRQTLKRRNGKGGFTPLEGGMEIWRRS